jgi:hypothetical protein
VTTKETFIEVRFHFLLSSPFPAVPAYAPFPFTRSLSYLPFCPTLYPLSLAHISFPLYTDQTTRRLPPSHTSAISLVPTCLTTPTSLGHSEPQLL